MLPARRLICFHFKNVKHSCLTLFVYIRHSSSSAASLRSVIILLSSNYLTPNTHASPIIFSNISCFSLFSPFDNNITTNSKSRTRRLAEYRSWRIISVAPLRRPQIESIFLTPLRRESTTRHSREESTYRSRSQRPSIPECRPCRRSRRTCSARIYRCAACRISCRSRCSNGRRIAL